MELMKKINLLLILAVISIFMSKPSYAEDSLTFSEAIDRLYRVNETIAASSEDIQKSVYDKKSAGGLFFPKLSLEAGYFKFDKDISMDVDLKPLKDALAPLGQMNPSLGGLISGFPSDISAVLQNDQTFTLSATATWTIFTGGKILAANKAAALKVKGAEAKYEDTKSKLITQLANYYFGFRLSKNIVAIREEVCRVMQDHYNTAVKMEKAGVLARVERMHAEVALSEARRAYEQSIRDSSLTSAALSSILNADEGVIPATALFILPEGAVEDLKYFQTEAIKANPQLKTLDIAKDLTAVSVKNEQSTYYPNIFVFANKDIYSYELTPLVPDWTVGVALSYNLFEGFSGYNKVQAAKSVERSVHLTKIRAEKDIKTLVEQQYITLENARADYDSVKASLQFTEEYLRARQKAFENGMATSLDVVDAELALSNAKLSAILAAYKFDIALIGLLETSGLSEYFNEYHAKASVELGL